ncbi:MAG: hypothetical protein FIB01_13050 [Gemmatimonadetes bacterium]|nr:hypothetical protein [Gemmatimonadota bacterium]
MTDQPLQSRPRVTPRQRALRASAAAAAVALGLALGLAAPAVAQRPATTPPNIVLFIADDLGVTDISPYGNVVVHTPSLEALAQESMVFTRAFAPSPTCSPSRSAIYTGLMPFRNGAHANHSMVRPGTPSLVLRFQALGYRVALAGKLHVGPESVFPFEIVANSNVPEPGNEGKGDLWTDLNVPAVDRWLDGVDSSRPFLLIVADHSPHVAWPAVPEYSAAEVNVPAYHIDTPEYRAARARYYTDVTKMDRNVGLLLASLARHGLGERTMVVFTADQGPQLAFGKWGLYDFGVRTPLIVKWPGHAPAGARSDAMISLIDLLPTFVEAAGGAAPGDIDGRSFLSVLTGTRRTHRDTVYATHTGDREMNRTPMRMLRTDRYKYILNLADTIYTTHMARLRRAAWGAGYWTSWVDRSFFDPAAATILWRYHHRPHEELFDLESDPLELRNLAAQPEYAGVLRALRASMTAWRAAQGDAETGPEKLEGRPQGPPYIPR